MFDDDGNDICRLQAEKVRDICWAADGALLTLVSDLRDSCLIRHSLTGHADMLCRLGPNYRYDLRPRFVSLGGDHGVLVRCGSSPSIRVDATGVVEEIDMQLDLGRSESASPGGRYHVLPGPFSLGDARE